MSTPSPYGAGKRVADVIVRRADGSTHTRRQTVGSDLVSGTRYSEPEITLSSPLSDWAESRQHLMSPQTAEMNASNHARARAADEELGARELTGVLGKARDLSSAAEQLAFRTEVRETIAAAGHDEFAVESMVTWATNAAGVPDNADGKRWWDRTADRVAAVKAELASRPADHVGAQLTSVFTRLTADVVGLVTAEDLDDPEVAALFDHEAYTAVRNAGHGHDLATRGSKWARDKVRENSASTNAAREKPMFEEKLGDLVAANSTRRSVCDPTAQARLKSSARRTLFAEGHSPATAERGAAWAADAAEKGMFAAEFPNVILGNSTLDAVRNEHAQARLQSYVRNTLRDDFGLDEATAERGAVWAVATTRANAEAGQRRYIESGKNMILPDGYDPYAHRL